MPGTPLTLKAIACALVILLLPFSAEARKSVLLVFDEDKDFPGLASINRSIRETFSSALREVEFYSESLNLSQFPDPGYDGVLQDYFRRKYAAVRPDVIIAVLGPSLGFLLRHGEELFPGIPIVFCGVDPSDLEGKALRPNITGVVIKRTFAPTLDIALRLQPDVRHVYVVSGTSGFDRQLQAIALRDFKPFESRVAITYLDGLPMAELRRILSNLPPHSVVIYVTLLADGAGRAFVPHEALSSIAAAANAPVYVSMDQYVGRGAVGGHVYSVAAHGRYAAEVALRILRGERPDAIPVVERADYKNIFDWREFHRWRLDERHLPAGSVMRFRRPTAWEEYGQYVAAGAALLVVQSALIVGLLASRAQRRRAQRSLAERLQFETLLSEVSAALLILPPSAIDEQIERMLRRVVEALDFDRAALAERDEPTSTMRVTHSWTRPGITPSPLMFESEALPWVGQRLAHGDVVRFTRLDELPEEAATDRQSFAARGVCSLAAVPLMVNGAVVGGLGFSRLRGERTWPDELVARLRLLADVFANVQARRRADKAVRDSEERRRRAEEEAQRQRDELAHALRVSALGELTASFAHEINQPLTAIMTNAQAARRLLRNEERPAQDIDEALVDIAGDAERASQTIRRLRALFRKDHAQYTPVDINALIDDVLGLLKTNLKGNDITVRFARSGALPFVLGDPVQLRQVILNLVVNAEEAIALVVGGPREIGIDTSQPDTRRVAFTVRDTGIGVKESELERIFEPFVSSKPQGLGMGLAISRSIVEAHGGRISAIFKENTGLAVQVELPIAGS